MEMRPFTKNASSKSKAIVEKIVNKLEGLKKPRKYFMIQFGIAILLPKLAQPKGVGSQLTRLFLHAVRNFRRDIAAK